MEELIEEFPDCTGFNPDSRLKFALNKIYNQTGKGYTGEILLVGVNYDKETKEHQCRIEILH